MCRQGGTKGAEKVATVTITSFFLLHREIFQFSSCCFFLAIADKVFVFCSKPLETEAENIIFACL